MKRFLLTGVLLSTLVLWCSCEREATLELKIKPFLQSHLVLCNITIDDKDYLYAIKQEEIEKFSSPNATPPSQIKSLECVKNIIQAKILQSEENGNPLSLSSLSFQKTLVNKESNVWFYIIFFTSYADEAKLEVPVVILNTGEQIQAILLKNER